MIDAYQQYAPDKAALLQPQLRACIAQVQQPHAAQVLAQPPTVVPTPWSDHILLDTGQIRVAGYRFTNGWHGERNGSRLTVLAGVALRDAAIAPGKEDRPFDPSLQGLVIVAVAPPGAQSQHWEPPYLTPEKAGALRVVAQDADRLILRSVAGATSVFDILARAFVPPTPREAGIAAATSRTASSTPPAGLPATAP